MKTNKYERINPFMPSPKSISIEISKIKNKPIQFVAKNLNICINVLVKTLADKGIIITHQDILKSNHLPFLKEIIVLHLIIQHRESQNGTFPVQKVKKKYQKKSKSEIQTTYDKIRIHGLGKLIYIRKSN